MSLRLMKLEAWALQIVDRVRAGDRVEDARVELKGQWPEIEKAARRIAGHANASFGADILWIIGLDEKVGLVGVDGKELADWWRGVCSHFDGITPSLTDISLSVGGQTLVCLVFETNRPPYVVRNSKYGMAGGGPVEWEVPWRDGTAVRSSTRNDLVRLLVPTTSLPEIEVLRGHGGLTVVLDYPSDRPKGVKLAFTVNIYMVPRSSDNVVIPFHRCRLEVRDSSELNFIDSFKISLSRPYAYMTQGSRPDSLTMETTSYELIAQGPGRCSVEAELGMDEAPTSLYEKELQLRFVLSVVGCEMPIVFELRAIPVEKGKTSLAAWNLSV